MNGGRFLIAGIDLDEKSASHKVATLRCVPLCSINQRARKVKGPDLIFRYRLLLFKFSDLGWQLRN